MSDREEMRKNPWIFHVFPPKVETCTVCGGCKCQNHPKMLVYLDGPSWSREQMVPPGTTVQELSDWCDKLPHVRSFPVPWEGIERLHAVLNGLRQVVPPDDELQAMGFEVEGLLVIVVPHKAARRPISPPTVSPLN